MNTSYRWLVIYDILDNKRLSKVAKLMESFGLRVQRSVFEMVGSERTMEVLLRRIETVLEDVDSIIFIPLCIDDYEKTIRLGTSTKLPDTEISDESIFL